MMNNIADLYILKVLLSPLFIGSKFCHVEKAMLNGVTCLLATEKQQKTCHWRFALL